MELQQLQLDETELHKKCLTLFEKLKKHLGFLHRYFNFINPRLFEISFHIFFREEHQTFRENMYHNLNQLQWQLKRDICHVHNSKTCLGHDSETCLVVLKTQFKEFFDSKKVNASDFQNKCWQKNLIDGTKWEPKNYRRLLLCYLKELDKLIDERVLKYDTLRMKEKEVKTIKEIENRLKEKEIQQQESLITEGATIEACLVTQGASLEACLVNEGIAVNDNTCVTKSSGTDSENNSSTTPFSRSEDEKISSMNECSRSWNENRSSDHESTSSGIDVDADIGSSNDSNTLLEAMLKFENQKFSKLKLNRGDLFRMSLEQSINERVRNRLSKEYQWVKLHDVPIQVFEEDEVDLMDVITIGIPSLTGDGFTKETIRVEYE
nr:hypothetical protein [Tanacetum cinerariifolium]